MTSRCRSDSGRLYWPLRVRTYCRSDTPGQPSVIYGQVLEERAKAIVYRHLVNGSIIDDWVIGQRQIEWDRDKPGGNFGRKSSAEYKHTTQQENNMVKS